MSNYKVYVGNLNYKADEAALKQEFSECGEITECKIITDFNTGRSKGFGFITFDSQEAMDKGIEKNGSSFQDRPLTVNKARENTNRKPGGNRGEFNRDSQF